uniref:Protein phosphatase, Mg2+/Mn2+ dependent, 1F n=1 Tax=Gasterosteus aculeatus aculeatus TaxID=481459 RepID=A0AAQ4Q621_GASAC
MSGSEGMEEEARSFLGRFAEEFPAALKEGAPLPVSPLSRRVTLEELHGESLELGRRLLAARGAPAGLSALLCQAALSQLLQNDLSPFHCAREPGPNQEEEQEVVLLESEGVQRVFLNQLIEVTLAWSQDFPKHPPPPSQFLHCSFNQLLGSQDQCAYYAVFDGHGGVDAATYAATHLHVALSKQESLQSDASSALKMAFKHTDDMFRGKAKRERLRSGTTGVVVLIQRQQLSVAWLGDSQALLVRGGQAVTLMDPHKPDREDEKQRVEDLGGCITFMGCWRVNGTYAVSRAIGDFDQKPYVSGDADCVTTQLLGDEDYVLLACDGFFDAVEPSEVPHLVREALRRPDAAGLRVAQQLVCHAKEAGSSDNITVMLVFLRPLKQLVGQNSTTGATQQ